MSHATVCQWFSETHGVSVTAIQQIIPPVGNIRQKVISQPRGQSWTIALQAIPKCQQLAAQLHWGRVLCQGDRRVKAMMMPVEVAHFYGNIYKDE